MAYSELWIEKSNTRTHSFRAAILVPSGWDIPKGFSKANEQSYLPDKILFVSDWFDGIHEAKKLVNEGAEFFRDRSSKFLLFMEIRPGVD